MTTAVNLSPRMRAGALPHSDERRNCRLSSDVIAERMQAGAQQARNTDPGDDMHGSGGSGPVVLITLCVLLPMALWGVVAAVRWSLGQ